jgi:DmsE family decaheme c-type cytochrome
MKVQMTKRLIAGIGMLAACWAMSAAAADIPNLPDLGGDAPSAAQIAKVKQAEDAKCTACHDENESKPVLSIFQTPHGVLGDARTPSCQSCHGPSLAHLAGVQNGKIAPPDVRFNKDGGFTESEAGDRAGACLACHKGTQRTHWDGSPHQSAGLACNDCHKIHSPVDTVRQRETQTEVCYTCHKDRRADMSKISHHPVPEGKMACSDCHNPHGSVGPHLMKKDTVNETCWTCHADKRGPFLWEHQPVTEDCTNCHNPHGSNITPLLKSRPPFLCQECHDGPHNSQSMFGPGIAGAQGGNYTNPIAPNSSGAGMACLSCHIMVHGSNNPAGALLHR